MSKEETKINLNIRYVCCPICGHNILRGEIAKNIVIRCDKCRKLIVINIAQGGTSAVPYSLKED